MSGRWTISTRDHGDGRTVWRVLDQQDAGRPVAEFDDRPSAEAHIEHLEQGPADLDEQDRQRRDEDESWGEPDQRIPWD